MPHDCSRAQVHAGTGPTKQRHGARVTDSPAPETEEREYCLYVNGICTTQRMALATGAELADMVRRNLSVVHNPTDSALVDLAKVGCTLLRYTVFG